MPRILITAFEPFGGWATNSSHHCLEALLSSPPADVELETRIYPVDFRLVRRLIEDDLESHFDAALHLGQAEGSQAVRLEMFAVNAGVERREEGASHFDLEPDGPHAFRVQLPLLEWTELLQQEGLPVEVSYHAGTYLCNALLYWSQNVTAALATDTKSLFIHLPLVPEQSREPAAGDASLPTLSATQSAQVVRRVLEFLSKSVSEARTV